MSVVDEQPVPVVVMMHHGQTEIVSENLYTEGTVKSLWMINREMRDLIIKLEWTPGAYDGQLGCEPGCPTCRYPLPAPGDLRPHAPDCTLAALLERIR